jgi:hypothetical protein
MAAVAALAVTWDVSRNAATPRSDAPALSPHAVEATPSPLRSIDPRALRDVFRFADEAVAPAQVEPGPMSPPAKGPAPASGPRLVGLIWRGGGLLAALAIDDEVLLLGPGDTAAGMTVVSVGGEAVRVRRSDGTEETLLPP